MGYNSLLRKTNFVYQDARSRRYIKNSNFYCDVIFLLTENYGNFTYIMNMYTNKNFSEKVEKYPLLVGISQRLYINLQVQSGDSDLNVFPDECKATPSPDYDAKPDHPMIEKA